jgi:hypothetical protein
VKLHFKDAFIGAVAGFALLLPWTGILDKKPYTHVHVLDVATTEDGIVVLATFRKDNCSFERLDVIGYDLGLTYNLSWSNLSVDGEVDLGVNYDRAAGDNTLRIIVYDKGRPYDKLEIRTRHLCGKTLVDNVFATVVLKENLRGIGE